MADLDAKTTVPGGDQNRSTAAAMAALFLAVVIVFWRHLFTSDVLFFRDTLFAHFPRLWELKQLAGCGMGVTWNSYEHFGESVVANPNYLLFYPTAWLAWLLPAPYAFKLHFVLHFLLGGAGSFLLARRLRLGAFACFLAGALFIFSGPIISLGNFYNMLPAAAWIPWAVLAADRCARHGRWSDQSLFAAVLTLQLFAGEVVTSMATIAIASAWALAQSNGASDAGIVGTPPADKPVRGPGRLAVLVRLLVSGGVFAALAAIQVFPAAAHLSLTERGEGFSYQHAMFWSLHPLRLLEIVVPELWGNPVDSAVPWLYLDWSEPNLLLSVFAGLVPIVFALVAVLAGRAVAETLGATALRASRFWLIAGIAALLLALGSYTPLGWFFYHVIPVFKVVRFPSKFLLPGMLALAQLAAIGFELLHRGVNDAPALQTRLRRVGVALTMLSAVWLVLAGWTYLAPESARSAAHAFAGSIFDASRSANAAQATGASPGQVVDHAAGWLVHVIRSRLAYVLGAGLLLATLLAARLTAVTRRRLVLATGAAGVLQLMSVHYYINPVADRRLLTAHPLAVEFLDPAYQPPAGATAIDRMREETRRRAASLNMMELPSVPCGVRPRIFAEPPRAPSPAAAVRPMLNLGMLPDYLQPAAYGYFVHRMNVQAAATVLGFEVPFLSDPEHILPAAQQAINKLVYDQGLAGEELVRLLRLGSIEYVFLHRYPDLPGLQLLGKASNGTDQPVRVFRVPDAMPRTWMVPLRGIVKAADAASGRQIMLSGGFDPARQVVVDSTFAGQIAVSAGVASPGRATLVERTSTRVELTTDSAEPSVLVVTDAWHPDWRVEVDDATEPLFRANVLFRGVVVPAGRHRVVFRYGPRAFYLGAVVSALTALGLALVIVLGAWKNGWLKPSTQRSPLKRARAL